MKGLLTAILAGTFSLAAMSQGSTSKSVLSQANTALQAGEADKALSLLAPLTSNQAQGLDTHDRALAHNLTCRVHYMLERWNRAAEECDLAVRYDSGNGIYHMWLGRTLGERASHVSFLSAYSLSKRVRAEFEEAARLEPRNPEVLADLGEFYYQAPGVVGGGQDKALRVASQMDSLDRMRALELRAKIAEQHKDLGTAENLLKQAISGSPHSAFQWLGLAAFYRRHQRWQEMESALNSCYLSVEHDHHATNALFGAGGMLLSTRRNLPLATKMLEIYLAGPNKNEDSPAFVAHLELARIKEQSGDMAEAQKQRAIAQSMAHDYHSAEERRH